MRRAGALLLGLLALALAALWVLPRLLDWEAYRDELAAIAGTRLGRVVTLDGPITLVLLPQPRIEAGQVRIGPEEDGVAIEARTMRLRLDLGALLGGRLEPREIVIAQARISLPWPPAELPSFRPPSWLTTLDARLEDSRLSVGGLEVEGLNARLQTGGISESLVASGHFAWRGQAVRFAAQLGRAGFDGIAPLDLTLATGGASVNARGVLQPGGGFDGRMEATGPDLAAFLPAPAQPFRAIGRLTAASDLFAANDLAIELAGQAARGAVTLRLAPAPRLDLTIAASRLDLDAWVAAARTAAGTGRGAMVAGRPVPIGVDLAAEATSLGGLPLRRLRGAFLLDGERVELSDVSALLPGETMVALGGAGTAGKGLDLLVRFESEALRDALAALGAPVEQTDPARLRRAAGQFRLSLQDGWSASFADLSATVDGSRIGGAGVLRPVAASARLSLGLGLTFDRLDLDGVVAPPWAWSAGGTAAAAAAIDLNLRVTADRLAWGGLAARQAAIDATVENGRVTLRRLGVRLGELDAALTGTAVFAAGTPLPRLSDLGLELGGTAAGLGALLPSADWARALPPDGVPVALRLSGGGPAEALALRIEGDLGELRVEAQGTLDAAARRGTGALTLRHPGAPRLLAPLLGGREAEAWLGQGSFAMVASFAAAAQRITAEHLDLVAGGLRARGQGLALAFGAEPRPRLTGRILAERLPLPGLALAHGPSEPLGLERLGQLDAELALEAERVEFAGGPTLDQAAVALRLQAGTLRLDGGRARLGGPGAGTLQGSLVVEVGAAEPGAGPAAPRPAPRVSLEAQVAEAALGGPLFGGLPVDIVAGRLQGAVRLQGAGHSPAALAATLSGEATLEVRDGRLVGYDLPAIAAAAALPDLAAAGAALRRALLSGAGATGFERLELAGRVEEGRFALHQARLVAEPALAAAASGSVDLARGALDLVLSAMPVAAAPPVDLRLTGPATDPRRLPEAAGFLRWKAEQG